MGTVIILAALAVAGFCLWRWSVAKKRQQQSDRTLHDLMAVDFMLKNSALESYKQMLRNPNPRTNPPPSELTLDDIPGKRRRF